MQKNVILDLKWQCRSSFPAAKKTFHPFAAQETVGLNKNLLRIYLIGPYFRIFSTNSGAISSQIYKNLSSTS